MALGVQPCTEGHPYTWDPSQLTGPGKGSGCEILEGHFPVTGEEEFIVVAPGLGWQHPLLQLPLVMARDKIQGTRDAITLRQFPGI